MVLRTTWQILLFFIAIQKRHSANCMRALPTCGSLANRQETEHPSVTHSTGVNSSGRLVPTPTDWAPGRMALISARSMTALFSRAIKQIRRLSNNLQKRLPCPLKNFGHDQRGSLEDRRLKSTTTSIMLARTIRTEKAVHRILA